MKPLGTGDPLRLGPYRLIGVLGAGGMGQVYLGRDGQGRTAAVKVLRPEVAHDPHMAQRFVREAHAAQAVRGDGVARVLAAQTEGGRLWIATEFLAGPTLDQAVERYGALEEPAVRALGAALVRTLHDIQGAGLVHRDLKPSNIVLTSRGPRIIDFGIARPEHGLTLTTTGQTVATPGYAAPEQVLGQRTGPAGDVFSLGVVLAYAAGGRPVYEGGHVAAVQYQVVHGDPELGSVPGALRPLVEPCLSKDPRGRPGLDWLGRALAPPRGADRAWKSGPLAQDIARREADVRRMAALPGDRTGPSRRRLIGTIAAGGTVLAAGGGGVAWWLLRGDEAEAGGRPWEAEPLSRYDEGTAPQPLWGPVRVAETSDTDLPAPLPVHDLVVVATPSGALRAYDVRRGERRWTSERTAATTTRMLAASDDVILTADTEGALLALDTKDGRKRWSAQGADAAVLLGADESAAYVATRGGGIRAVDLTSHSTLWTVPAPVRTSAKAPAEAAVAEGRLVIHDSDGSVAALDTRTGRTAWGPHEQGPTTALAPVVADGVAYLGGKSLRALALVSGEEKWARAGQGGSGWSAPAVRKGVVYAVDGSDLSARRADDGAEMWTLPFAADDRPLDAPVAEGGTVWAAVDMRGDQGVVAVDVRSGSVAWPYAPGAEGGWRLAAAGNRVFALESGTLTAMPVF
ncbi:PQQ-binding-like beta-propeller repeat protein [Streptomyces sp. 4503]|uniref:PQQ-binding-like beta-propeller repeat protein n=1 Tax=Streptomyces niphimycinicus TaxID=2842201 RepID=A0ABS6CN67_9ACTN|nr:serine/threonine-protein kinase [Streptomyces niphimycinicus]MBU3868382.1 PQQ-binding-like beta-propeller repeat protein [Streptomyces niphimycinicus]